jgi:hypothetical protein
MDDVSVHFMITANLVGMDHYGVAPAKRGHLHVGFIDGRDVG